MFSLKYSVYYLLIKLNYIFKNRFERDNIRERNIFINLTEFIKKIGFLDERKGGIQNLLKK